MGKRWLVLGLLKFGFEASRQKLLGGKSRLGQIRMARDMAFEKINLKRKSGKVGI